MTSQAVQSAVWSDGELCRRRQLLVDTCVCVCVCVLYIYLQKIQKYGNVTDFCVTAHFLICIFILFLDEHFYDWLYDNIKHIVLPCIWNELHEYWLSWGAAKVHQKLGSHKCVSHYMSLNMLIILSVAGVVCVWLWIIPTFQWEQDGRGSSNV